MTAHNTGRRSLVASTLLGTALTLAGVGSAYAQSPAQERPTAAATERAADRAQDADERIEDRVAYRLETDDDVAKYDVKVEVDNGVATLSGEVATQAQRTEAARLADDVTGVTRIENKIEVDAAADTTLADRAKRGLSKTGDAIDDAWITTKVSWFFMGEDALEGSNINVDTKANVVTLKGTVRSEAGRARAKALAARTEGVKDVKDELTIAAAR